MSSAERHDRVFAIFDEVCDLAPDARRERLHALCAGDEELQRDVEEMLAHDGSQNTLLDAAEAGRGVDAFAAEMLQDLPGKAPTSVGKFAIRGVLGSGGMGVVYLGEQASPQRRVAIKVMRWSADGTSAARRFEREAEMLARLQHPGIAQIFESGTTADGGRDATFIAMEYIEGSTLAEYVTRQQLSTPERVRILIELIRAIHHAHLRGVLHRDLKPSNVLVTSDGQVKVIDFGVARALDADEQASLATRTGQVIGTSAYMSPEQARGDVDAVDARTDIYALGVLAYEMLSGVLPLDLKDRTLTEVARIVNDVEPARLGSVSPECRGDLEVIVGKAMAKEPERRYQSAAALADDFERHLGHQPVEARPATVLYQLRRLARRHRAAVVGATATLLAILAGAAIAVHYAIRNAELASSEFEARTKADENAERASQLADQANQRAEELDQVVAYLDSVVTEISPTEMGQLLVSELVDSRELALRRSGATPEEVEAVRSEFRRDLEAINATEVALRTMEHTIFDRSLAAIEARFDPETRLYRVMLMELATTLARYGLNQRALETYRMVVDASLAANVDDQILWEARLKVGTVYRLMGQLDDALAFHRAAAEDVAKHFPKTSDPYRQTMRDVALTLMNTGQAHEAEVVLREMIDNPSAEEHDETYLTLRGTLGILLCNTGRCDEAYEEYSAAHAAWQELDEPEELALLTMRWRLGREAVHTDRLEEGRAILADTLASLRSTIGDGHWLTVECLSNVAESFLAEERYEEAAQSLRDAVAASRNTQGVGVGVAAPDLVRQTAQTEFHLGNHDAGRACAEEAFERALSVFGPGDRRTVGYASVLDEVLRQQYRATRDDTVKQRIREVRDLVESWR